MNTHPRSPSLPSLQSIAPKVRSQITSTCARRATGPRGRCPRPEHGARAAASAPQVITAPDLPLLVRKTDHCQRRPPPASLHRAAKGPAAATALASALCLPHALVPRRHLLPSIGVLGLSAGRPPPFTLGQPRRPRAAPRSQIAVLILFPRFSMMQRRRFLNKPSIASLPPRQSLVRQNFHLTQGVLPR